MTALARHLSLVAVLCAAAACGSTEGGESGGTAAGSAPKKAPEVRATRVEVAAVSTIRSTSRIVRPGEVKGAREAQLASSLGGFVERVLVETGSKVKKGQPLVYVDTRTHAAQANLTRVELQEAERELKRLESLGKAVASARVDAARSRLARAKAQHQISTTRQSRAVIRAPFAGAVVDLDVEQGEVAAPGSTIARVLQLDPIHVSVSVTDRDVAALTVGGPAQITTSATAGAVTGTVERIEPAADLRTRTFLVEVAVANPERRLLPGMIAQVAFQTEHGGEALYIPQDFIVTKLEGNGVFVADGTTARWRPLELGGIVGTDVEVVKGLVAGERVVVLGHRTLSDGDPLIIAREGRCCESGRVVWNKATTSTAKDPAKAQEPQPAKAGQSETAKAVEPDRKTKDSPEKEVVQ